MNKNHGGIAQLGEHLPCKQGVKGSNPFISIGYQRYPYKYKVYLENCILKYQINKKCLDIRGAT